jgi:hypothetical protein
LTITNAKDYALRILPCTMTGVTDLFNEDLGGYIDLDSIVGLKPHALGYTTLVFRFRYKKTTTASTEPIKLYLLWWFKNKLHGDVGPYSNDEVEDQVWWVKISVEIKEDRDGNYGDHASGHR